MANLNRPRDDYLKDDQFFMAVALMTAQRSRDPSTQVGACIVKDGKIISTGYNHMPIGDDNHTWTREGPGNKYLYVCYAVNNAIISAITDLKDAILYVTLFPSNKCATEIIQAGIKSVFYIWNKYADTDWCKASKKMLNMKGVVYQTLCEVPQDITLKFTEPMDVDPNPYGLN